MTSLKPLNSQPDEDFLAQLSKTAALFEGASAEDTLRWAVNRFDNTLTMATGFGAEGAALIDMAVRVDPSIDIFFLDTSFLFPETLELKRRIEERYGISIRTVQTSLTPEEQSVRFGPALWKTDPDLCCRLRKLESLKDALAGRAAWITAIRRDQTAARATARVVEWDYRWRLVKVNPMARWTREQVWNYISENDVPYNPLHDRGYPSIGCTHCTAQVLADDHERSGRWRGNSKTECGLHGLVSPAMSSAENSKPSNFAAE